MEVSRAIRGDRCNLRVGKKIELVSVQGLQCGEPTNGAAQKTAVLDELEAEGLMPRVATSALAGSPKATTGVLPGTTGAPAGGSRRTIPRRYPGIMTREDTSGGRHQASGGCYFHAR